MRPKKTALINKAVKYCELSVRSNTPPCFRTDTALSLASAAAQLELADADLQRFRSLREKHFVSQAALEAKDNRLQGGAGAGRSGAQPERVHRSPGRSGPEPPTYLTPSAASAILWACVGAAKNSPSAFWIESGRWSRRCRRYRAVRCRAGFASG